MSLVEFSCIDATLTRLGNIYWTDQTSFYMLHFVGYCVRNRIAYCGVCFLWGKPYFSWCEQFPMPKPSLQNLNLKVTHHFSEVPTFWTNALQNFELGLSRACAVRLRYSSRKTYQSRADATLKCISDKFTSLLFVKSMIRLKAETSATLMF